MFSSCSGLSWLWRTWQETAPGYQATPVRQQSFAPFSSYAQPARQLQQQQTSSSFDDLTFDDQPDSSSNNGFAGNAVSLSCYIALYLLILI